MNSENNIRFIETPEFPIHTVNTASEKEKQGGGRPPYWEMVFWWTRKPLAGARAVILGSILPGNTKPGDFLTWLRLDSKKTPHRLNPNLPSTIRERLRNTRLLDPFAGFGSIPLEAARLGVGEVVAAELLPTSYIFLKAILEYPKKYGKRRIKLSRQEIEELGLEKAVKTLSTNKPLTGNGKYEVPELLYDVARWGQWITSKLREDPDIQELYDEDVAVYIGTWEVKCPVCGRYSPLVGNWWLSKVKGKKYAYMKPKIEKDGIDIEIVEGKTQGAPTPNVRGRPEHAECLHCGSNITYINPRTGRVYRSKKEVKDKQLRKELEFYPKYAIKQWFKTLEEYLNNRKENQIDKLKNAPARPRILVKVKIQNNDLKFEPATQEDQEKLWRALEKLRQQWGDPDIPTELIAIYENRAIWTQPYGIDKFYRLFNPRQLLTLTKLVKLVREAGKKLEEEKLREGWGREEAFRYAEAVTTYLAIALTRYAGYSNILTPWKNYTGFGSATALLRAVNIMVFRGIAMSWNWTDYNINYNGIGFERDIKSVVSTLSYLVSAVSNSPSRVRVLREDATILSRLGDEKFDVVVTDPPYRDDVPYVELSDFYYVWLKRALSDDGLVPRFHRDVLIYRTQWESFATREISYNKSRLENFGVKEASDYYERLLGMAFKRMSERLSDDGLIVTYFAHSSPEAWIELVEAGWRIGGLRVTRAWAFSTESAQRITARGKTALESSIVVVWRRRGGDERIGEYTEVVEEAFKGAMQGRMEALNSGLTGSDLFLASMLGALSVFTRYDRVVHFGSELSSREVVRESYAIATRVVAGAVDLVKTPEALFYLAAKSVFRRYSMPKGRTMLQVAPVEPIVLSSQDVIILSYGFLRRIEEGRQEGYKLFEDTGVIKGIDKSSGANVAKQKAFILLEPLSPTIEEIKRVLGEKCVNPIRMEALNRRLNTVDVLHLLEYFAKQGRADFAAAYKNLYASRPNETREAVELAKVISGYTGDPERDMARLVVDYVQGR